MFRDLLFVCLMFSAGSLVAQTSSSTVVSEIDHFFSDPLSRSGRAAAKQIMLYFVNARDFGYEAAAISDYFPWIEQPHDADDKELLVVAFVAGSLRSHFNGTVGSSQQTYDGLLGTIDVYRKLKAEKGSFHMMEVDRFIELDRQRLLKSYIEEKQKRAERTGAANPHAFGTFGTAPAFSASRAGAVPKASGDT